MFNSEKRESHKRKTELTWYTQLMRNIGFLCSILSGYPWCKMEEVRANKRRLKYVRFSAKTIISSVWTHKKAVHLENLCREME